MKEDIFTILGASNHSKNEREPNDYYATNSLLQNYY